jgi:hypothetical protein
MMALMPETWTRIAKIKLTASTRRRMHRSKEIAPEEVARLASISAVSMAASSSFIIFARRAVPSCFLPILKRNRGVSGTRTG